MGVVILVDAVYLADVVDPVGVVTRGAVVHRRIEVHHDDVIEVTREGGIDQAQMKDVKSKGGRLRLGIDQAEGKFMFYRYQGVWQLRNSSKYFVLFFSACA